MTEGAGDRVVQRIRQVGRSVGVGEQHRFAAGGEKIRRGHARLARSDDESLHRSLSVERATMAKMMAMIQKRTTTLVSRHPESSKWWCSGDILKMRRPVNLNEATCSTTDIPSSTK